MPPNLPVVLVAVAIVSLGLYVSTLPEFTIVAASGTVLSRQGNLLPRLNFTVHGDGGRLVGSFTATNQTNPWIHPSWYTGLPRGPSTGVCGGRFDVILPPGPYTITFFTGADDTVVRITQTLEVLPSRAPEGAPEFTTGLLDIVACPGIPAF